MATASTTLAAPRDGTEARALEVRRRKMASERRWSLGLRVSGYVAFIGAWAALSAFVVEPILLPSPVAVGQEMVEIVTSGEFVTHFSATIRRALLALVILYGVGVLVGTAMGLSRWWEAFFRDWIHTLISLPSLIFVLLAVLIFGTGAEGPLVAIVITVFPFVAIQVWEGVKDRPRELIDMARAFDLSKRQALLRVVFPSMTPFLITALTYGFALTWKITMLTELFGGNSGVGFQMQVSFRHFQIDALIAWSVWFFLLTLLLEREVLQRLSSHVLRWRDGTSD